MMSLAHIRFIRNSVSNASIQYFVESSDFCETHEWEIIGIVTINLEDKHYKFVCTGVWEGKKVIPPEIFSLSTSEQKQLIKDKYNDFGYGSWSSQINSIINATIKNNEFDCRL